MRNKNGLAKNWEVVQEEIATWRALMPIHIKTFKDAQGIAARLHKGWNLVTESIRLLPRTLGYSALIILVLDGALHIWLWST